jgi:plasmid stability protein
MLVIGMLLGSAITYLGCLWLWRSMQADDAWWQENEDRRNQRWPVTGRISEDLRRITIDLPDHMLTQLRADAAAHGVSVVEHMRQCVSLWQALYGGDPEAVVTVRDGDEREHTVRLSAADPAGGEDGSS